MSEDEIMSIVMQLADRLGIAVEQIARIFIEGQAKVGMIDAILILFVFLSSAIVFLYTLHVEINAETKVKTITVEPASVIAIVWFVVMGVMALFIAHPLHQIVAPEYMGLKEMITTLTGR